MSEKRSQILKSALMLFAERGIDATPTALIAKQAGVSNGTLFHYYKSKEVLIEALADSVMLQRDEASMHEVEAGSSVRDTVRKIWDNRIEWCIKNPTEFRFLRQIHAIHPHLERKVNDRCKEEMIRIIELGLRQNIIGFMPVDFIHALFEANVEGMVNYLTKNPVKFRTPEFMRQSFEWYWNGIRNHAKQSMLN